MRSKRFNLKVALLILVALVAGLGWTVYVPIRQERLNRTLITAIKQNHTEKALTLLAQGADPNVQDEPPQHLSFWQMLLDKIRGKRPAPSNASTALWLACDWGEEDATADDGVPAPDNWRLVKALLDHGAKPNLTDKWGNAPLTMASFLNKTHVCQLLVAKGAHVNTSDGYGDTPFSWAITNHNIALIGLFANNGADVNAMSYSVDLTPLMMVQEMGKDDSTLTEILLAKGARVNASTPHGRTALLYAIDNNRINCVKTLIQHGADVNFKASNGGTPLKLAKEKGLSPIIQLLKQAGAKE